ncbi:hypothetical protein FRC02_000515 [Tulasnella sp. 418]|nr:hypothetical protein FRC02_000515 [Tulasnella sp. 418]
MDICQLYWRQVAVVAETGTNSYILPNRQFDLHKIPPLCEAITDGQHQLNHLIERRYEHPVDKGTVSNNASGSYNVVLGGIIVYPVFVIVLPFRGEQASVSDNCEVGHTTDSVHQSETLEVHNIRYLIQVSAPSLDWSWTFLTSSVEASSSKVISTNSRVIQS